jgi:uncharacterized repeat protein (TIGR01451 family)
MKNPRIILKVMLFATGLALVAAATLSSGSLARTYAFNPLVITETATIPPPPTTPPPSPTPSPTPPPITPPPPSQRADPYVRKSVNVTQANAGDTIEYTLIVGNNGNVDAVNVQVRDTLPAPLSLVSVTASRGTVIQSGNSFIVDIGTLPPTEVITIKVVAKIGDIAENCPTIVNVSTLHTTSDGDNPDNNISIATITACKIVQPTTGGQNVTPAPLLLVMALGALFMALGVLIGKHKPA